jgi:hypothetical protein
METKRNSVLSAFSGSEKITVKNQDSDPVYTERDLSN